MLSQQFSISSLSWVITRMVLPLRASLFSLSVIRRIILPVKTAGRLIKNQYPAAGKDGAGDGKPLLLSAGQGGRVRIPVLVKAKFFQQMYCTVFAFFRQFGIQQQFLRHTRRKKLR